MFNKNVVYQYTLAVVLAETREFHLGKMRERFARKTNKILWRAALASSINRRTSSKSIDSGSSSIASNSSSRSNSNISEVGANFNYIELRAENSRRFRNFRILGREASFAIRPLPEDADTVRWLENAFHEVYSYALHSGEPNDYVSLSFDSADRQAYRFVQHAT